ncbi:MAG TPA: riboflavin-specific deaminase [Anaerolineae bacterium]|nr:riboflavin-specific deaminase [Anaerolineae bacterium]
MDIEQQHYFMQIALELSRRALPDCLPNPPVGCVLVKDGQVVASGYTQKVGEHHAEVMALANYAGSLEEVSAFVTLEPCAFFGRTPSCALALIQRKISTIYVSLIDPDPRNNGKGLAMLREAGIEVIENVYRDQVATFLSPYLNLNRKLEQLISEFVEKGEATPDQYDENTATDQADQRAN